MSATLRSRLSFAERRRVILDAALSLFAKHGFREVSVEAIAAAANITKPVLYDHFPSKQRLFLEVVREIRAKLMSLGATALSSGADRQQAVRAAVDAFFLFSEANPGAIRVLLTSPDDIKGLKRELNRIQDEVTVGLFRLLTEKVSADFPDTRKLPGLKFQVEFIKQGMHGLAKWWPEQKQVSRSNLTDAVMNVIWKGISR
jgi:AcrR family transcriptional regulator